MMIGGVYDKTGARDQGSGIRKGRNHAAGLAALRGVSGVRTRASELVSAVAEAASQQVSGAWARRGSCALRGNGKLAGFE